MQTGMEESIEICGEHFRISSPGLDEEQVKSFVKRLIDERNRLLDQEDHIKYLTMLAEKTCKEASDIAEKTRRKAEEDAESQTKIIIDQAKEQAARLIEQKLKEAEGAALKYAKAIRDNAMATAENCLKEAEKAAEDKAKSIIMKAMAQSSSLVEKSQSEADTVVKKQVEAVTTDMLEDARKHLQAVKETAEAQAKLQAKTILSSFRSNISTKK